eukprot:1754831-Rhodomonas_salina.2
MDMGRRLCLRSQTLCTSAAGAGTLSCGRRRGLCSVDIGGARGVEAIGLVNRPERNVLWWEVGGRFKVLAGLCARQEGDASSNLDSLHSGCV